MIEEVRVEVREDKFPTELASNPIAAAGVLDAIALFELLGAKWLLAVTAANWNAEIHEHTADEVRHTKMVQDAAKKLRWDLPESDLARERKVSKACYEATEKYLSRLSTRMFLRAFKGSTDSNTVAMSGYALLAFLIERRIMKIYPYFAKYGATAELREMARTLIGEERKHLGFVTPKLPPALQSISSSQTDIVKFEEELASIWMDQVISATKQ